MASFSQHAGENWLLKKKMDSEGNIHAPSRRGSTPVLHTLHMTKYFTPTGDEHGRGGGGGDMVIPCPHNPSPDSARCTSSLSNGSLDSTRDLDMFECLSDGGHSNSDSVSLFSKSSPSPILSPFLESTTSSSENENGTFDVPGRYTTAYSGIQGDESDNQCGGSGSSGYHARSNDGADCDDDDYDGGSVYGPDLCSASGPRTPDSLSLPSCRSCSSDYSVDGPVMRGNNSLLMETEQAHNISYLTESAGSPAAASDLGMSCDPGDSPTIEAKRLRLGDELLNPHDRTYSLGKGAGPSPSPRGAGGGFKSRGTPQGPVTLKSRGTPQGPVTLPSDFAFATPENCRPCGSVARRQQPPGSARRSGEYMSAGEKTFVVSPRGDGDGKTADMQTSTPMQSLNNNNTYSLPSFDESPFTKARTAGGSAGEGSGSNASQEQPGSRTTANADGGAKKRAGCGDANANANATFVVKSTEAAPTKVKKFSRPNLTSVKTRFMLSKQSTVQKPAETKQNGETRTLGRAGDRAPRKPSPLTLGKPAASLSKSSASPLPTPTGSTNQSIKAEVPPSGKQDSRAQKRFVFPKTRQRLASDDTAAAAKPSPDEKQQSVKTASPNFLTKVYKAVTQSKVLPEKQQKRLKQSDRKGSTSSQEDAAVHKQSKTTVGFQSERSKTSSAATSSKPVTGPSAATPGRVAQTPGSVVKRAGAAASEGRKGKLGARQSPSSPRCNRAAPAAPAPASTPASPAARAQAGSSRQLPSSMAKLRLGSSSNQATSYGDAFNSGGGGRVASSKASGVTTRAQAAAAAKTPTKTPATTTGTAATKSTASSIKPAASTTQRKLPARPTRTLTPQSVDKGKATRPNARNQTQNQNQVNGHRGADPPPSSGPPLDSRAKNTKAQSGAEENRPTKTQLQLQGLKGLLHQSNLRCEGLSIVLQHCVAEREETLKKYADLSQELVNLREELANSSQTCERLALEKEEVAKMREQHRVDLAQLEERLQVFYAAEWEKTHQMYQEEADKCKAQMEDQLKTLQHRHEVLMNDLEASHSVKMESIKQQAEQSLAELCQTQEKQLETLNTTLREIDNLTGQVEDLKADNLALNEKLKVAEELRKAMAAEAQKDSHTLYLEQELESLKVVLDIKSKQLQQQDQKLMQMDKVLEKNEKLEKSLQMIQRENEDLKARMDRHVSLARQLSVDQMTMQENLEKESKENKRLSRENEELLWKLHNGDLNLTNRKSPPATPSSLPLQSP